MVRLTTTEARVLYSVLERAGTRTAWHGPLSSAVSKLYQIAGKQECCRDCAEPGIHPSQFGGMECDAHHKPRKNP